MPVLIGFLVIALVAGLSLAPKPARLVTAVAGAATFCAFAWSLADGKGDDPAWLIALPVVGVGLGVAVCEALVRRRATA